MTRRVLHVVRSLRLETGGLAEAVRNLAAAQCRRGDTVSIVSLDPADAAATNVRVLGCRSHGYGYSAKLGPWLWRHASEFEAVIVHGLWQYQSFGTWRALRGSKTPYFVFPHGMLDVWFKRAHPLKHIKKWLYWPWADYCVLRDAAAVCYTTEAERDRSRQSFCLYSARESIVSLGVGAPPPVEPGDASAFAAAYPELVRHPYLLFLGRIHPKKGIDLLIDGYAEAFGANPAAPRLVIAGPGNDAPYRGRLEAQAAMRRISDRVVWLPMLTGELKWAALRGCAAFALFSHQENFGVAVVEALACGKPVLVSHEIAVSRDIGAAGAGIVCADSPAGAAAALSAWRDLPEPSRHAMGKAALALYERCYSVDRAAEMLDHAIETAISKL